MRSLTAALILATAPVLADAPGPTTDHPLDGVIIEIASGDRLTPQELAGRLAAADIAILGEVHDNAQQHVRQAWLIGQLAPAAIAFEMMPDSATEALDTLASEDIDAAARLDRLPEVLDWVHSGWPDWALYRPVFEAAGGARLIGAGVARDSLMGAIRTDAATAYGDGADKAGLTQPLSNPDNEALTEEMRVSHCDALPTEMLPGMVEAQRLRDARFAAATLRALEEGSPAVLVTGNGHARADRGVPAYLARMASDTRVLTLGQVEVEDGAEDPADYEAERLPYDFAWFSERAEREDPCAVFNDRSGG